MGILINIERKLDAILKKCKCKSSNTNPIALTLFNYGSETAYGCAASFAPELDTTGFHNGEGVYPAIGDSVFQDAAGQIPIPDTGINHHYLGDVEGGGFTNPSNWMEIENGIRDSYNCR